ncbi:hypothetical protein FERRO_14240 [Ferrovum sp. JA12]|nr:hypothetical protein FERRO_14240 [Ferrovum sp. JA12]
MIVWHECFTCDFQSMGDYPLELQDSAVLTVLQQAEELSLGWAVVSRPGTGGGNG